MKTVKNACKLQPNATEINVGDQIEQLDQIINGTDGYEYFGKTHVTDGMRILLTKGMARLAGKTNDTVFHLKQAMGGGKTHLMVGLGILAKDPKLRAEKIGEIPYQDGFKKVKIAAFNGKNHPSNYFWGEIAKQLDKETLFKEYWESGAKAPDESAWLKMYEGDEPILILLDEMPPYFHYYNTQALGRGTIADVATSALSNMITAALKRTNVCIVVSDLEAAYDTGGKLIQTALDDATQEVGRAEINITPVNLESNEIYEILRKRLFLTLPDKSEISEIASVYASRLSEAARAKTVERSAEALANDIEMTYPFHPSFKSIVALFKENEKFRQTRGLMELVSRLLKSVWANEEDVYLIGAQHFDLAIQEVREKLADISNMRDVIAKDLWDSTQSAHAQIIDISNGNSYAKQVGTLLLTASLSTAVNSVKGLSESEIVEYLIDPNNQPSGFKKALQELDKTAWYLHQTQESRYYFDHQENLTKKLQGYAEKAPQNKVEELIRYRLNSMYEPTSKEAYEKVLPLPEMDEASAVLRVSRAMLIISPDGKVPPDVVIQFFNGITNKNNILVLTGEKSSMASLEKAARHVYAVIKADKDLADSHPQRKEFEERKTQYEQDFQTTILNVFDKLLFPGYGTEELLRAKPLDSTYPSDERYNGERQVIKTLTADPIKLYTQINENFDALRARAETLLFGNQNDVRKVDLIEKMRQITKMPWLPPKGFDLLVQEAYQRGVWEDIGNGYISKKPKPKTTQVVFNVENNPDDTGKVRLKIDTVNAGNTPRIHFQEDGAVNETSPVLNDNVLITNALRVQFLAVDPTGKNQTGAAVTWTNNLVIRCNFDESKRKVELFVVPKGKMRYSIDGSEPRNGTDYIGAFQIANSEVSLNVFAESDGLEAKRVFKFAARGVNELRIVREKPAQLYSPTPKRLDNSAKTYEGIRIAKESDITFEQVTLQIGSSPKVVHLSLGELKIKADFIENELAHLRTILNPEAPVIMSFKKVYTTTGHDLEQFASALGIELKNDEISQE